MSYSEIATLGYLRTHGEQIDALRAEVHELVGEIVDCDDGDGMDCPLLADALARVRDAIMAFNEDERELAITAACSTWSNR